MKKIGVLLVDDHTVVRQGLRALFKSNQGFDVVGEANNGRNAIELCNLTEPDVVVMDIRMPDLNGIDATRQILSAHPNTKVIALSAQSDHNTAREMIRAGATGFILKDSAFEELIQAIGFITAGKVYISPPLADAVRDAVDSTETSAFTRLSPREREILQLFSEGKSTKEIALHLKLSVKTVETHRRNVMAKTQASGIAELTRYAIREGISPP